MILSTRACFPCSSSSAAQVTTSSLCKVRFRRHVISSLSHSIVPTSPRRHQPSFVMASTSPEASSPKLTLKLLVDTKEQRVLYAEARKDVVDFLFSLLTLPVGTVVKILSWPAPSATSTTAWRILTRPTSAPVTPRERCSRPPEDTLAASYSSCQSQIQIQIHRSLRQKTFTAAAQQLYPMLLLSGLHQLFPMSYEPV
jgi:hypothetical protein